MIELKRLTERFCIAAEIDYDEMMGTRHRLALWNARYMAWHYLHYDKGISANRIARFFNRDRVNIFRGIRLLKHQMKYDSTLRNKYYGICEKAEDMDSTISSDNDIMEEK